MRNLFNICLFASLLVSCATPTQPTGGEPDRSGPAILSSEPADGTINFSDDQIRFNFDKYIARNTFQRAFSIEPDIGIAYSVRWRGRSAVVRFDNALPDSTTMIFRLSTDLGDANNNRMKQPYTLALSTGPAIDKGEISGRVLNREDGRPWTEGIVLLYRHPIDYSERANYAVQPDTGGHIRFNYLREGTYNAFWVDDRNRNKRWDPVSEAARPFPVESVKVIDEQIVSLDTAYIAIPDTITPNLQGVGLLSSVRMRLRFSEDVEFEDGAGITVLDSLGQAVQTALPLYTEKGQRNVLYGQLPVALDTETTYTVSLAGITDRAGNRANADDISFTGSAATDTTAQRIIRNESEWGIYPDQPLVIRYAAVIDDAAVTDSLIVIEDEITHTGWDSTVVRGNLLYLYPATSWMEASRYQPRLWSPQRQDRTSFDLKVWHPSTLGDLEISIPSDSTKNWYYRLINLEGMQIRDGHMRGRALLEDIPEGDYILQAFSDPGQNGSWDQGAVEPYRKPEPGYVDPRVKIRNRMTTELVIGVRSGEPADNDGVDDDDDDDNGDGAGNGSDAE
ncbi:MAG: Ig-like domain-containing protein [Cyclonatronaceae bacterium]